MNGKFSKWNKRCTAWILIIVGLYLTYEQYPIEYVLITLGSGLTAIGLSIWHNIKKG